MNDIVRKNNVFQFEQALQQLLLLETTLGNLYHLKEEIVMAPPGQAANGLMIYIHSNLEIDEYPIKYFLHGF